MKVQVYLAKAVEDPEKLKLEIMLNEVFKKVFGENW
tara:strand:- start:1858 stop:1965 length:108 start_codon:yes stop_codon:yes gene_type:complete